MKEIKTKSGLSITIDETKLNNMELLDAVCEIEKGNTIAVSDVVDLMLGKENKKKLYEHVRTNGIVPIDEVSKEIMEIFELLGDAGKN